MVIDIYGMEESQNIEYKQSWRDEYLKWICGFANAQGGRIYVGIDGNILQMVDRVIWTLRSKYLISPIHYEGLQRIEPLEIPESALRECICNSIVHKDYMGAHIQMKVYDGRVRLWNPGGLPEDMTVEDLVSEHESRPRNPLIANVFYKAGFIETWGRGISKICEGFKAADMETPTFESTNGGVTVIIPRKDFSKQEKTIQKTNPKTNPKTSPKTNLKTDRKALFKKTAELTVQQRSIIEYIKEHPTATRQEITDNIGQAAFGGVRYNIARLQQLGILRRVGGRKSGFWEILKDIE